MDPQESLGHKGSSGFLDVREIQVWLSLVLLVLRGHLAPLDLKGTQESQGPISLDLQDRMGFQGVLDLMEHQENLEDQTSFRVLQGPKGRRA